MSAPSCENCRHVQTYGSYFPPRCFAPNTEVDTGRIAAIQRSDGWFMSRWNGTCGKEGRFFEQTPP